MVVWVLSEHGVNSCLVQFFLSPSLDQGDRETFGSGLWAAEAAAGFQSPSVLLLACINVPVSPFEPVPSWPGANTIPQEPRRCCPF